MAPRDRRPPAYRQSGRFTAAMVERKLEGSTPSQAGIAALSGTVLAICWSFLRAQTRFDTQRLRIQPADGGPDSFAKDLPKCRFHSLSLRLTSQNRKDRRSGSRHER